MARVIGNRKSSPLDKDPVSSLNSVLDIKSNNHDRLGFLLSGTVANQYRFNVVTLVRMNYDRGFDIIDGSTVKGNLFRDWKRDSAVGVDIRFSEDRTWCAIFLTGTNIAEGSVNDHRYGVQFFKWNPSLKRYDHLDSIAGNLATGESGDISYDGQFVAKRSGVTPYCEFYQRTGDTWTLLPTITGSVASVAYGKHKMFNKQFGYVYWGNNTNDTAGAFVGYEFNGTTFTQVTLSGIGTGGYHQVDFTENGYFAGGDVSNDLGFWKTSDGINFTDLNSNITGMAPYAHYNISWDPTGTYLFANVNNAAYTFVMYKRDGDTLTRLESAFDQIPPTADITLRTSVTWSPDSKYVFIGASTGTPAGDGCWMYERVGDQFYRVDLVSEGTSNTPGTAAALYPDKSYITQYNDVIVEKLHWW